MPLETRDLAGAVAMERRNVAGTHIGEASAGQIERGQQERDEHTARVSFRERIVHDADGTLWLAKQRCGVGAGGEGAEHRMRARHHQRGAGALVGHVAEREHDHVVADAEMIDQVAAHFLGRFEQDVD